MTCEKRAELQCDECLGEFFQSLDSRASEARREARASGWRFRSGRDICPDCVAAQREHKNMMSATTPEPSR